MIDKSGPDPLSWRQSNWKKSIKVGRICWKSKFWAWSERVKEWWMMRAGMMRTMSWQLNKKVNRDKNREADETNLEVDSKDEVMHI